MPIEKSICISLSPNLKVALEAIVKEVKACAKDVDENGNNNDKKRQDNISACVNLEKIMSNAEQNSSDEFSCIPLNAIKIAKSISKSENSLHNLNESLKTTNQGLIFPKRPAKTNTSEAYKNRINRLKLSEQERKYTNLTKNLDSTPADDATLKSMTYAASIGANMIVAPISIGVLMYFFAGKLFSFLIPGYVHKEGDINIHGVIAGVIAGVAMLFIEMILFVIRNHEMDRFVSKKMKKHKNPFGYNEQAAKRTYQGEQD